MPGFRRCFTTMTTHEVRPFIRKLILEGRRLGPVPGLYQALDLAGVPRGDGAASRLIACSAELHRQHPELVGTVRSR